MPAGIDRYRLVVFDLDGTLYHQGPVRRDMLGELLVSGGAPGRLRRLRLLGRYRRLREAVATDDAAFAGLAAETGHPERDLRDLVAEWMLHRPLSRLRGARVAGAASLFDRLRAGGATVAVWSDYPVRDKLAALELVADHAVWAGDPEIGALKPDPAGLRHLMAATGIGPEATLMVGDRPDRDGAAAAAVGVDFLLRADRAPRGGQGAWRVADFRALGGGA